MMNDLPVSPYWQSFDGAFYGLLKWQDMDMLWDRLKASPEGWYIFDLEEEVPPQQPADGNDLKSFLIHARQFLRKRHRHDYCGFIYVNDPQDPAFIKIFDPKNMGTACGCSGERILPRWTLTRIKPDSPLAVEPEPAHRVGLINRLLSRLPSN